MTRRVLALAGLAFAGGVLLAAPAGATITKGPCKASAVITTDDGDTFPIDAADSGRVTLPPEGDADWKGTEGRPKLDEDAPYSGKVTVKGPPGLEYDWTWDGESAKTSSSGVEPIDISPPAGLLGGVKATVSGTHSHAGVECAATIDIKIDGSVVNPGSIGAAVLTVASGAGLLMAARGAA